MISHPRCYKDIKELAKTTGNKIPDLLAMSCQNDPFYIMPAQKKQAEWFANLWSRFNLPRGVHLRRIHYKLVSLPEGDAVNLVDGRLYQNTEGCWQYLASASKAARCLSLVAADAFQDQRNPDPVTNCDYPYQTHPHWWLSSSWSDNDWLIPEINTNLAADLDWIIPRVFVGGYDATAHDQPFHLEIISEKSTMDDIVIPLCEELAINYAPATGFQSITGVIGLLKRLRQANKPGVIFYISDFDPAGSFMPPSVARQIEFWLPTYAPGLDVLLLPIVLTKEQVIQYSLPPIPIKDTDKRQDNFLNKYDVSGATELDALEALHPGELEKIIQQAVAPYRDSRAKSKQAYIKWQAGDSLNKEWEAICRPYAWRIDRLKEQAEEIINGYQDSLENLQRAMSEELEPVKQQLESLRQAIKQDAADFDPILPDSYKSPVGMPEQFDGLFDSRRDYLTQIKSYKLRQVVHEQPQFGDSLPICVESGESRNTKATL